MFQNAVTAIADERRKLSRRSLLSRTATIAMGGALAVAAAPHIRSVKVAAQAFDNEVDVLNYALTLEHLEATFYRDALALFPVDAFADGIYANLELVGLHEADHVATLIGVVSSLGGEPVAESIYDFGYGDDPAAFLEIAAAVENLGVSAYDGAASSLSTPELITAAGTIVAVEARHASYLNLITGQIPFPAAFETPLSPDEVLATAGPFIVG